MSRTYKVHPKDEDNWKSRLCDEERLSEAQLRKMLEEEREETCH